MSDKIRIVEFIYLVYNLYTYNNKQNINKDVVFSLAPAGGHQAATGDVDSLKWTEIVKLCYSNILLLLLLYFDIRRNSTVGKCLIAAGGRTNVVVRLLQM